jgi:hypothetical protein
MQDDLYVSQDLRTPEAAQFLSEIANAELLVDSILSLTSPELYKIGQEAINKLKETTQEPDLNVNLWPSSFSGIQVINNRTTPPHRDKGAAPTVYDLLLSVGTHSSSRIGLVDVQTTFSYAPGTVVLVCGRVILHEVSFWKGGERICLAHYMRDAVHDRLGLPRPDWVDMADYTRLMSQGFLSRLAKNT